MSLLASGRALDADVLLERVDRALATESELSDVRARVLSLRAQAALEAGRPADARLHAGEALRLLRAAQDGEGLAAVRELDARAAAELDKVRRSELARGKLAEIASIPVDDLLARTPDPLARADALIRHAGALHAQRDVRAVDSASLAVIEADRAGAVREQVLARLALVECNPAGAREPLLQALAIADRADETTLIGLIARAAELAGVALPVHHGPLEPGGTA